MSSKQQLLEKQRLYDEWKRKRDANVSHETPKDTQVYTDVSTKKSPEYDRIAEENRRKYPEFAAFVDEVRKVFPNARVVSITPHAQSQSQATHELDEVVEPTYPQ